MKKVTKIPILLLFLLTNISLNAEDAEYNRTEKDDPTPSSFRSNTNQNLTETHHEDLANEITNQVSIDNPEGLYNQRNEEEEFKVIRNTQLRLKNMAPAKSIKQINYKEIDQIIFSDFRSDYLAYTDSVAPPSEITDETLQPQNAKDINQEKLQSLLEWYYSSIREECDKSAVAAKTHFFQPQFNNRGVQKNYSAYKQKCGLLTASSANQQIYESVKHRIIFLMDSAESIKCTGVLINNTTAITARHCFYNKLVTDPSYLSIVVNDNKNTKISQFRAYEIACNNVFETLIDRYDYSPQACDYIAIKFSETEGIKVNDMPVTTKIERYQKLTIVGYHQINQFYEDAISPEPSNPRWKNGVVVTDSDMCVVFDINQKTVQGTNRLCYTHGCQTIEGMSGAPVFIKQEGQIMLAGIQIGTTTLDPNAWRASDHHNCNIEIKKGSNNLAITTSLNLL